MTKNPTTYENSGGPTDPVTVLIAARPDPQLDVEWGATRRDAVLAEIFVAEPAPARKRWIARHRRSVLGGAVAACVAVAVTGVVLPSGSPGGPGAAAAATLDRLAVIAGSSGRVVGPGQYAYSDTHKVQTFSAEDVAHGSHAITMNTFRTWTAPGGDYWGLENTCLRHQPYNNAATSAGGNYSGLNSEQYAALPTTPDALAGYLDEHPEGDNRGSLNRFLSVGDFVGDGLTTPKLRATAIRVLANTNGITVDPRSRDALGRNAIKVDYRYGDGTVSSLYFAPSSSALLETQTSQNDSVNYRSVTRTQRVVDSLPHRRTCG